MSNRGCDHLVDEITAVIHRFCHEYEMSYAEVVGVLEMVQQDIIEESREEDA